MGWRVSPVQRKSYGGVILSFHSNILVVVNCKGNSPKNTIMEYIWKTYKLQLGEIWICYSEFAFLRRKNIMKAMECPRKGLSWKRSSAITPCDIFKWDRRCEVDEHSHEIDIETAECTWKLKSQRLTCMAWDDKTISKMRMRHVFSKIIYEKSILRHLPIGLLF